VSTPRKLRQEHQKTVFACLGNQSSPYNPQTLKMSAHAYMELAQGMMKLSLFRAAQR
tara:strand:- start:946 stop:1116 length:171 start_codon:yes stop_codon:yes gene_type:complete